MRAFTNQVAPIPTPSTGVYAYKDGRYYNHPVQGGFCAVVDGDHRFLVDILPLKKHIYYLDSSSDELKNVPGYKTYYESVNDFSGDEVQEQALAQYPDSDNIFKIISQIDGK